MSRPHTDRLFHFLLGELFWLHKTEIVQLINGRRG